MSPMLLEHKQLSDFGSGFYCTSEMKQAELWAFQKLATSLNEQTYVNVYEFDIIRMNSLSVKRFVGPSEEWIDFVYQNRTNPRFKHDYDIVTGPLADNQIRHLFSQFEAGLISKDKLRFEASNHNLRDQYLFHTEESLKLLTFVKAEILRETPQGKIERKTWYPKR